ncbi:MAG: PRC-barrel domain-containing protein [Candidatus Thermoplasmatota archaeon]|jgi:sporulation protein YlmC with PRC-barrel domain|nr:PRC-barrel domain-containing protein [Candidatus Thermoplasmatota archaeon]MCL5790407.1 PRC-barrel domain-containing protein [Candidatus Thermoplasmatota archaeon]
MEYMKEIIDLPVYTDKGILVGNVYDIILDSELKSISGILIKDTNTMLVEDGMPVSIPYRWVKSVGDAVLLHIFPDHVKKPPVR